MINTPTTVEEALADPDIKRALQDLPHPNEWRNSRGFTLYDYYLWRAKTKQSWFGNKLFGDIMRAYEQSPLRKRELQEAVVRG